MDAASPLVSIVTPSFNQGRFLRRTIDSVLGQDYPFIDYQVMDGGSQDESPAILASYGDRLRWVSEPDRGQSHAINTGLRQARGDILAYLNSDDTLRPGAVSTVVGHFRRHPEWDVVYGRADWIDEGDAVLGPYPTRPFSLADLGENCFLCQPAVFWRRSVADRVGLLDEGLHYAMDYDYWLRIANAGGRFGYVPEVLASSRVHAATKTLAGRLEMFREIFEVCRRYAGNAGFGHYLAYWHHRLHERRRGWPRLFRGAPHAEWWLAVVHSRWRQHEGRLASFCGHAARAVARKWSG